MRWRTMKHSYLVASIILLVAAVAWIAFKVILAIVTRD
jgi:hypothetical protein